MYLFKKSSSTYLRGIAGVTRYLAEHRRRAGYAGKAEKMRVEAVTSWTSVGLLSKWVVVATAENGVVLKMAGQGDPRAAQEEGSASPS